MTSFHQNQSPPISEEGEGAEGRGYEGGGWEQRDREGGRGGPGWLDPLQGRKGGGNGFHTRKSIRAGNSVELAAQSGRRVFKNSSLGVISKLQSAWAE